MYSQLEKCVSFLQHSTTKPFTGIVRTREPQINSTLLETNTHIIDGLGLCMLLLPIIEVLGARDFHSIAQVTETARHVRLYQDVTRIQVTVTDTWFQLVWKQQHTQPVNQRTQTRPHEHQVRLTIRVFSNLTLCCWGGYFLMFKRTVVPSVWRRHCAYCKHWEPLKWTPWHHFPEENPQQHSCGKEVNQSRYRPGVAQRVPGS